MKKYLFVFYILLIIDSILYSALKKDARIIADFYSFPLYYEFTQNTYCLSLNGSLMAGAKLNKFTIGAEIFDNYSFMTSRSNSNGYESSWNILRIAAVGFYEPVKWFELKLGLGGAYNRISYQNTDDVRVSIDQGGLSILLDVLFIMPFEYIELKLVNRLDLFFLTGQTTPYYYGGIRCNFNLFFNWMKFYIEAGGTTWNYNNNHLTIQIGMFTWGIGCSFDLKIPGIVNYTAEKVKPKGLKAVKKEKTIEIQKIDELKKAKEGDVVTFYSIIFFPDSEKIMDESFYVLDQITKVLIKRKNINIEIYGYTNDVNNPKEELELSKKRSEMVKNYLQNKGIDQKRMKCYGYGSLSKKTSSIDEVNRRVEIKVSERELF